MNKWIKRSLIAVAGLVVLGAGGLSLGAYLGDRKAQRHIDLEAGPVGIPDDAASVERGRYLFFTRGCTDCHGADGAGKAFIDDGHGLYAKAPNISTGPATWLRPTARRTGCARCATVSSPMAGRRSSCRAKTTTASPMPTSAR